ncbi:MAG: hypothetical protein A2138_06220 [Deltaproteobacteria bacterium RBG_16_71_12]|nr:MAG: hypothetical protein A2138_06220 [Deltaproteobacteria bacterium RBG_16_71_12]
MARLGPSLALGTLAALALALVACPADKKALGSGTVKLSVKPALFLRATPDGDASPIVGAFIPDEVPDSEIDETSLARTRCSSFIKPNRVPASGSFKEVTAASSGAAGKIGVKSIANIDLGGSEAQALLVKYELLEKMSANVDADGLAQCCAAAPDQCTKRYISGAIMADGEYFAATEKASNMGLDATVPVEGVPVTGDVMYQDDLKWQRQAAFKRQYFAFTFARNGGVGLGGKGAPANPCAWVNQVPPSADGQFFVGVSNPMDTEKLAREDAMRDAREQVVKYLGEYLTEEAASRTSTVGKASDLTTLVQDEKAKTNMAQGLARFVKDQQWCGPDQVAAPSGMKHVMKALAFFSNGERKAASLAAMRALIDTKKAAGDNTAPLEKMLKDIEAQP